MSIGKQVKRRFTDPINLRLTEPLLEEIQQQAFDSERTLSSQIRWLLQLALREAGKPNGRRTTATCP